MKFIPTRLWFDTKQAFARKLRCFFWLFYAWPIFPHCWLLTEAKVGNWHFHKRLANENFHLCRGICKFAYRRNVWVLGFWVKRATYEEQPVIKFQYQTLLVAATSIQGDFVAWSTFPHLNNMLASNLRIPAVSVRNNTSPLCETQQEKRKLSFILLNCAGQRRGSEPWWEIGPVDSELAASASTWGAGVQHPAAAHLQLPALRMHFHYICLNWMIVLWTKRILHLKSVNMNLSLFQAFFQPYLSVVAADVHGGDAEPGVPAALLLCSWSQALHQWRPQAPAEGTAAPQGSV